MDYLEGRFYKFKVIRSERNLSIVSDGDKQFTYPGELLYGEDINLFVKSIIDDKLYFSTNPFEFENEKLVSCELISVDSNEKFGVAKVNYNSYLFNINFPKWIVKSDLLENKKHIRIKHFIPTGKNLRLTLKLDETVNHYKYEFNEEYTFEVLSIKDNTLIVLDTEDGITYKTLNHFSNISLKENDSIKLKFVGLDKNLIPSFIQDKSKSSFIAPSKILPKKDVDYLIEPKTFDYESQKKLKDQIKEKDNFWIITTIKYYPDYVRLSLNNGDAEAIKCSISLFNKISGFIKSKEFFKSIPKSISETVEPLFFQSCELINEVNDLIEFQKENDLEDLFKSDLPLNIEKQKRILNGSFRYKLIDNTSLSVIESIIENVEDSSESKEKKHFILNEIGTLFLNKICTPILKKSRETYFSDYEKKREWLKKERINSIVEIANSLLVHKKYFSPYKILNLEGINLIQKISSETQNTSEIVNYIHKRLLDIIDFHLISIEPEKLNENTLRFKNKIILLSRTLGLRISKKSIFLITGKDLHLVNFLIEKNGFIDGELNNIYSGNLNVVNIDIDINIDTDVKENEVIKTVYNGQRLNNLYFTTYGYKNKIAQDALLLSSIEKFHSTNRYKVGDVFNAKVESIKDRRVFLIERSNKNLLLPEELNKPYSAVITRVNTYQNSALCPKCGKQLNARHSELYKSCIDCKRFFFHYVELYIKEIDKIIFINRYSIKGVYGKDFLPTLSVGQLYDVFLVGLKDFKYSEPWSNERKTKYIKFCDVEFGKLKDLDFSYEFEKTITYNALSNFIYTGLLELFMSKYHSKLDYSDNIETTMLLLSKLIKSPKSYLVMALNQYKRIISPLTKNIEINKAFLELKSNFEEQYKETVNYYPEFQNIISTLSILETISTKKYGGLVNEIETNKNDLTIKLAKTVLIRNLIIGEGENENFLKTIDKQIIGFLNKNIKNLSFGSTFTTETEEDENLTIIKLVEKNEISETTEFEFKETLFVPVLNRSQLKSIENLEGRTEEDPKNKSKYRSKINEINESVESLIKSKAIHKKIAYSAIKNICAMLNTNPGKVIIGIRDNGELIGLENDYKVTEDFDEFQQRFEAYWKNFVHDSQIFRPYIKLNKVSYKGMDFVVFDVSFPESISEPCFVSDIDKENAVCFVKNSSTTDQLDLKSIRKWKRKRGTIENTPTYIYLMKDVNNKIKIGISKDPEKRRGTLMAQEPNIRLLKKYLFPDRKVAMYHEKYFHEEYISYNTNNGKGEWFDLDENQIKKIKKHLKKISVKHFDNEATLFTSAK